MPNKSKKTSKVLIVATAKSKKKQRGAPKQGRAARSLTGSQRLVKGLADTGLAYAKGGVLGAAMTGAGHLYEYLGDASASPVMTTISAPVSQIPSITGSFSQSTRVKQLAPDTVRLSGSVVCMRIQNSASGIAVFDAYGNYHYVTDGGNGAYIVSMRPNTGASWATGYQSGFPNYLCPHDTILPHYAAIYNRWRPERLSFRWIPSCPTSTQGSVLMAWQPDTTAYAMDAVGSIDQYGSKPYGMTVMSQQPAFASSPVWQSTVIGFNPRKHGVCENTNDWLGINYYAGSADTGTAFASDVPMRSDAGYFMINVASMSYALPGAAYDVGYVVFDFDYTLHNKGAAKMPLGGYLSPEFLRSPLNEDVLKELKKRHETAVIRNSGRTSSILYDLGYVETARKIRQFERKRVSVPHISELDRESDDCDGEFELTEVKSSFPRSVTPVPQSSAPPIPPGGKAMKPCPKDVWQ